jgi:hypothetical protein
MKTVLFVWILAIVAVAAFAGFLAYNDKDGWGWFLFVAVLMAGGVSYSEKGNDKDKNNQSKINL